VTYKRGIGGEAPNEKNFMSSFNDPSRTDHARRTGPAVEAMYQLLLWLIPTVSKFPRDQKFFLGDRIQNAATDALTCLIAATYTRNRDRHLEEANLCLEKLRFFVRLAYDLRLLLQKQYEHAARLIDGVGKLVGGWRKAHHAAGV